MLLKGHFGIAMGGEIKLNDDDRWYVQTSQGHEFGLERVKIRLSCIFMPNIELFGTYGIHCSYFILNTTQKGLLLRSIARTIGKWDELVYRHPFLKEYDK